MPIKKLLILLLSTFIFHNAKAKVISLITNDLKSWYQQETSLVPGEFFGIYKLELIGEKIYLGLGTDRPASMDGAMLASVPLSGGEVSKIAYINEQGFIDMMVAGDYLHIPGADPGYPEFGWNAGNWYRFNYVEKEPKFELKRNLPLVVHGWGQWFDEKNKVIYHATSQVTCNKLSETEDCFGVVGAKGHGALFKSSDFGDNWERVATLEDGIGTFRTYDVAGTENALFATWADNTPEGSLCGLAVKKNGEQKWTRVKYMEVSCLERLVVHGNRVFTLSNRGPFLLSISDQDDPSSNFSFVAVKLPSNSKSQNSFNHIAINSDEFEIFFSSREGIYATKNLKDWTLIEGTESLVDIKDLRYLINQKILLVATPEQIYKIDL